MLKEKEQDICFRDVMEQSLWILKMTEIILMLMKFKITAGKRNAKMRLLKSWEVDCIKIGNGKVMKCTPDQAEKV